MLGLVSKKKYQVALQAIDRLEKELARERTRRLDAIKYSEYLRETRYLPEDFCQYVEYMKPTTYGPICSMMKKYMNLLKDHSPAAADLILAYRVAHDKKQKRGSKK